MCRTPPCKSSGSNSQSAETDCARLERRSVRWTWPGANAGARAPERGEVRAGTRAWKRAAMLRNF